MVHRMPSWIEVTEALKTAIATALAITVERRYTAYYEKKDVATGKYLIIGTGAELDGKRGIDLLNISADIGYQIALPAPTETYPDPKNNIPWLDAQSNKVQALKDLFAAGDELTAEGVLRRQTFAGATYLRWNNTPIYRPDFLRDNSIFTSVIRFEFRLED